MYLHGLSKDEILCKKRFESYEESSKKNQIRMVTLFGQQVKIFNVMSLVYYFKSFCSHCCLCS